MGLDLTTLLDIRLYQVFDVDEAGRVLAGSDDSGSTQLIEIQPDGSHNPLTALPGPCAGRYLPGQRAVLVSHDEGGNELHQISVLRLPVPAARPAGLDDLEPLVRDPRYMHTLSDVRPGRICYLTNRRNGVDFDPVIRDLASGEERALQLGDRHYDEAVLSADGRWLALTVSSAVTANAEHVALVDLTARPGRERLTEITPADAPAMNHSLSFSPDGMTLYFSSNNDREFTGIVKRDLATGDQDWLITDEGYDLSGWLSPDGNTLLVERNNNGASDLALHDPATGAWQRHLELPATGCGVFWRAPAWAPNSSAVALTFTGDEVPSDVLLCPAGRVPASPPPRLLTRSAAGFGGGQPVRPEQHKVPTPDGQAIPCLVYRPAPGTQTSAVAGSAVLVVHGGPEGQARQSFDLEVQVLAAAGHAVLVPNVRGSTGYGKRWYTADDGPRRLDSVADMAALHAHLPELGLDPRRAGLFGGSYGGYMVLAGLAFQPELWAAGIDIVGIASLVTFLENTSAYRRAYREREYGTLASDREFLQAASPLTRIDDIVAPLFIIHGANDPRVPLTEAEQIHAALTRRGRECELVVYGDEGHGLAKRANRADALPRACAFLARHLAAGPAPASRATARDRPTLVTGGEPSNRRLVLILGSLSAFGPLSIDMYLPALPAMARGLHASTSAAQLTLTGCLIGLAAGQLLAGPVSDARGRRMPLLAGVAAYAVASAACVVAPDVWVLLGLRLLQGFAGAAGIVIARAVVRDLYAGDDLARFYSYMLLVNGVAPIAAPVIGAQLLRVTDWRGVFVVLALIGLVLLLVCARWLPETWPPARRRTGGLTAVAQDARTLLADLSFGRFALATGLAFGAMFAYISGSSFVLQAKFGISPQLFSVIFATNGAGIIAAGQLSGRLLGRVSLPVLFAAGLAGSAAGGVLVLVAALTGAGLPLLLPALFLVVASIGFVLPNGTALGLASHADRAGSAAALIGSAQFAIGAIAAPLVGVAGPDTILPMAIVISALGLSAWLIRPARQESRSATAV